MGWQTGPQYWYLLIHARGDNCVFKTDINTIQTIMEIVHPRLSALSTSSFRSRSPTMACKSSGGLACGEVRPSTWHWLIFAALRHDMLALFTANFGRSRLSSSWDGLRWFWTVGSVWRSVQLIQQKLDPQHVCWRWGTRSLKVSGSMFGDYLKFCNSFLVLLVHKICNTRSIK